LNPGWSARKKTTSSKVKKIERIDIGCSNVIALSRSIQNSFDGRVARIVRVFPQHLQLPEVARHA
jgi:hypothetical protein